ncbi:5-methylcytosine restriction system specificity protein McrC [Pseudomonas shirazica]|uniref:5-methylcytosine restriction system specificity protein McrC n=1 Tax=Pseudomonas shirazica TaxID=1940636 RepID=UPI003AAE7625
MISISNSRKIFVCKEFEPLELPLEMLLNKGKIQVYSAADKYFDLDYRGGKLVVAPKSFVGLIPVNDQVAIHVIPRFSVKNLFYIISRTNAVLRFIEGFHRDYLLVENSHDDPIKSLAQKFSKSASEVMRAGILRRYQPVKEVAPFSGSLSISDTVATYRSQGIKDRHVWEADELTDNILENAIIRFAALRVINLFPVNSRDKSDRANFEILRHLLTELAFVNLYDHQLVLDEFMLIKLVRSLPRHNVSYSSLLWLSYLILMKKGLTIESGGPASFDTFVVSMADVFEAYTREVIREHFQSLNHYSVRDGNVHQVDLFLDSSKYKVKPDIYVLKDRVPVAILDAKYKPNIKSADRYEVIAFCEALSVKTAVILSPAISAERVMFLGKTPSGIKFWQITIDLGAEDFVEEQRVFIENIEKLLVA